MSEGKTEQSARTRRLLISSAEKLIALNGVSAVSSRQISKAAGQGNNYAVGHHFGSKDDLVRATLTVHNDTIEALRQKFLDTVGTHPGVRDWLRCLVGPEIEYLGQLGAPTYFARFFAQVSSDPAATVLLYEQMADSIALMTILDRFYDALPAYPDDVLELRNNMTRHMIVNSLADIERAAEAQGRPLTRWQHQGDLVVDALTGMWLAPVGPGRTA
ncbi:TetR/AcrR family transcriptional regulator [Gordonia sp. zg691]|uniref:TetR/AcrR family transcriptional regulator n=1 Tax=Gordonia jinghuaiqii TaxID=2758710 RepID=A0A7D7R2R2_9ACTN|nr:TetR/AcrR family transcriptional regulator [Gordonia jinghuaiqii]MBD0860648.1 TetR/AcrR family transcriptional regulator [Gordonia jinghuaiqii]MCR5978086.1 TetR family transcriptional regulator [Gordonia jinghuaiqii]QMT01452.1 TetR/AcrR family transcriptional regulator [Gordonia jinghuaiqii]